MLERGVHSGSLTPALVTETHGNKCTFRKNDGTTIEHIHMEDVMLVPENARNLEKEPIKFEELDSITLRRLKNGSRTS